MILLNLEVFEMNKFVSTRLLTLAGASLLILPNFVLSAIAAQPTARSIQDSPYIYSATSPSSSDYSKIALQQIPTIDFGQLPSEAQSVVDKINNGGSFASNKDGSVFENIEGRLPQEERGWYHEYTVRTPGVRTRGAQRIITGQNGEIYYTPDHYRHFYRVR